MRVLTRLLFASGLAVAWLVPRPTSNRVAVVRRRTGRRSAVKGVKVTSAPDCSFQAVWVGRANPTNADGHQQRHHRSIKRSRRLLRQSLLFRDESARMARRRLADSGRRVQRDWLGERGQHPLGRRVQYGIRFRLVGRTGGTRRHEQHGELWAARAVPRKGLAAAAPASAGDDRRCPYGSNRLRRTDGNRWRSYRRISAVRRRSCGRGNARSSRRVRCQTGLGGRQGGSSGIGECPGIPIRTRWPGTGPSTCCSSLRASAASGRQPARRSLRANRPTCAVKWTAPR